MSDLSNIAFFDWNFVSGRAVEVNSRERSGNVERNAVLPRKDRDHIRADLVRNVAICGNSVRADNNRLHLSLFHHVTGHVVGDKGNGNVVLVQLPGGETGSLQIWPRFVRNNGDVLAGIDGSADNAQRRAPNAARGQSSGIAVRQDGGIIFEKLTAELGDQALR